MNQIKLNAELEFFGKKYTVLSIDPPNLTIIGPGGTSELTLTFADLVSDPSFKPGKQMIRQLEQDESKYRSVLDTLPNKTRDEVSQRYEMIRPLLVWDRTKGNDLRASYDFMSRYKDYIPDGKSLYDLTQLDLLKMISQKHSIPDEYGIVPRGCSVASIKRYLSAYRKAESELTSRGEEGLVARKGSGHLFRKDNRTIEICHPKKPDVVLDRINVRLDEKYIPIIKEAIEQVYLTLKRPTKKAVYDSISVRCMRNHLEPVSINTVTKILERIDPRIRTLMREGNKAAEAYDPVTRGFSNEEAQYPLHLVEIDHTQLDLDVVDESTGQVIGRPWITLGIDVYSRMIWCMYVSFEPPSANVVRKAIEHGVFPKKTIEKFGTRNEWEVFGIPDTIYLDNGPEFRNVAVKRMITETLKSNVRYRPVKTPRYGGTIERMFGTLNQFIHRLDGTRKSNPRDLGEYDPEASAIYSLDDVRSLITIYITDVYHTTPHKGLPLHSDTPIIRYRDGLKIAGFPEYIFEDEKAKFQIDLLPVIEKAYTRDGIQLHNVLYKSDKLSHLIADRSKKYLVKYDVDDISKIYLFDPDSKIFVQVPAVKPSAEVLHKMNRYTFKQLRELDKLESKTKRAAVPGTKEIERVIEKMAELTAKSKKRTRAAKQRQERMKNTIPTMGVLPTETKPKKHEPSLDDLFELAGRMASVYDNEEEVEE